MTEENTQSDTSNLDPEFYGRIRQMAVQAMRAERKDHTLQETALANEVWVELLGKGAALPADENHAHALARRAMSRYLIDYARRRNSRGGKLERLPETGLVDHDPGPTTGAGLVTEAMEVLGVRDPQLAEIVRLRFVEGKSTEQVAESLGVSERTLRRQWSHACEILRETLGERGHA